MLIGLLHLFPGVSPEMEISSRMFWSLILGSTLRGVLSPKWKETRRHRKSIYTHGLALATAK